MFEDRLGIGAYVVWDDVYANYLQETATSIDGRVNNVCLVSGR